MIVEDLLRLQSKATCRWWLALLAASELPNQIEAPKYALVLKLSRLFASIVSTSLEGGRIETRTSKHELLTD